VTSEQQEEFIA
jgi:hypothetical protein